MFGNHFLNRKEQQSLKFLLEQRARDGEQQKWVSQLLGFDFGYNISQGMKIGWPLSCVMEFQFILLLTKQDFDEILEETLIDDLLKSILWTKLKIPIEILIL